MSPARSKRTVIPQRRSRTEVVRAVAAAAGIVLGTAILVWLMRPGPSGTLGTGGLMNRQPRSSAVVIGTLILGGAVAWFVLRVSRRARGKEKVVLPIALGVVLVAAIVVGFAWPEGLLRHDVAPPPITTTSTVATTSTSTPASSTTGASGATGATSTTAAAASTTTPTTGTATTTVP